MLCLGVPDCSGALVAVLLLLCRGTTCFAAWGFLGRFVPFSWGWGKRLSSGSMRSLVARAGIHADDAGGSGARAAGAMAGDGEVAPDVVVFVEKGTHGAADLVFTRCVVVVVMVVSGGGGRGSDDVDCLWGVRSGRGGGGGGRGGCSGWCGGGDIVCSG